jgi:hypothetical protein
MFPGSVGLNCEKVLGCLTPISSFCWMVHEFHISVSLVLLILIEHSFYTEFIPRTSNVNIVSSYTHHIF